MSNVVNGSQPADPSDRSTADLVRDVSRLVPELVREELDLAKAELTEKGKHAGIGAGLFGGAGMAAFFGVAVLIAAVILVVAGILALVGKKQVTQAVPPVPEQAVDSAKQDVRAVKESAHR